MASFFERLWESIFTPGPTPTLLVATNASFAALQLLFFALLIATYSIHFVILSGLTAGLWWAINWFATEIRAAQDKEEEAKRIREARREKDKGEGGVSEGEGMDTGDDTEVDPEVMDQSEPKPRLVPSAVRPQRPETQSTVFVERPDDMGARESTPVVESRSGNTTGASTRLAPEDNDVLKQRKSLGESTSELSTDSEWEKLSQDSEDR
jgi:hypothetical protein